MRCDFDRILTITFGLIAISSTLVSSSSSSSLSQQQQRPQLPVAPSASNIDNKNNDEDTYVYSTDDSGMLRNVGFASLMGESALIDGESGRVYWESRGTASTLQRQHQQRLRTVIGGGLTHIKATVLTILLLLVVLSFISNIIRQQLLLSSPETSASSTASHVLANDDTITASSASTRVSEVIFKRVALFLIDWTILKFPLIQKKWFIVLVLVLYVFEAYHCSTRRYLSNALSSDSDIETYIESIRQSAPIITWKVRTFHYELRSFARPFIVILSYVIKKKQKEKSNIVTDNNSNENKSQTENRSRSEYVSSLTTLLSQQPLLMFLLMKKVITNHSKHSYGYQSYKDNTVVGLWKRSKSTRTGGNHHAPFTKIILSKLLILSNSKTRQDYFQEQNKFITEEGPSDVHAEYTTSIDVPGFKRRMLGLRPVNNPANNIILKSRDIKLFRLHVFWIFTLLGLTVPYRIWLHRHCDEIRVTIIKEISFDHNKRKTTSSVTPSSWMSTLFSPRSTTSTISSERVNDMVADSIKKKYNEIEEETFRRKMQEFALYSKVEEQESSNMTTKEEKDLFRNDTLALIDDMEVAATVAASESDSSLNFTTPRNNLTTASTTAIEQYTTFSNTSQSNNVTKIEGPVIADKNLTTDRNSANSNTSSAAPVSE